MNVKTTLVLVYSAVMALTLVAFGFVSYRLISYGITLTLSESLQADFDRAKPVILQNGSGELADILEELDRQFESSHFVYDTQAGDVLGNPLLSGYVSSSLSGITPIGVLEFRETSSGLMLAFGRYDDAQPNKLLVVARDSDFIKRINNEFRRILFSLIPVTLIIASLTGYVLANQSMKQIRVINTTAKSVNPADFTDRIPVKHNDELGRLSRTLNSLFDRIHGFIERQHRFTSDASHDLKSPLTSIRAEAELALRKDREPEEYRQTLGVVVQQTQKMKVILDDLLTLAGMDAGPRPDKSMLVDLSSLVNEIVQRWRPVYAERGIDLTLDIQPSMRLQGEPDQFGNIFDNLISNAVKFTPDGGTIFVSLQQVQDYIEFSVTNSGMGITPEQMPLIFERFYRATRKIEGTGLGLSIVKGTVDLYGGKIEVASEPGKGTTFRVLLPYPNSLPARKG